MEPKNCPCIVIERIYQNFHYGQVEVGHQFILDVEMSDAFQAVLHALTLYSHTLTQ